MGQRVLGTRQFVRLLGAWRVDGVAAYAALADRIRLLVTDGRVTTGSRLPAERELATALDVGRRTVHGAYALLARDGFVASRRGSGSIVRMPVLPGRLPLADSADVIDLSRATSSAVGGVREAAIAALDRFAPLLDTDGYELAAVPALADALAARFTAQGLPTERDGILVTTGSQSAISLLARVLLEPGDRVVVESPGYPHAFEALRRARLRLLPLRVDAVDGWSADEFDQLVAADAPAAAFLMPDFHNPTGATMTDPVRAAIVRTAERRRVLVISDETTAELDIDRGWRPHPLASFAANDDTVVVIGSASKTIWGGLRVGWIRAAPSIIRRLVAARLSNDLGAAVLDQLMVAHMLDDFDAVLAERRARLAASRDELLSALAAHLPDWRVVPPAGGLAAWVALPTPTSSELTAAVRGRGLLLGPGPWFGVGGEHEARLRIPITAEPDRIRRAIELIAAER